MIWSWACIAAINLSWTLYLWIRRRSNHPWLAPFFTLYAVTDLAMWVMSPRIDGGLDIIAPSLVGRLWWIGTISCLWVSWFLVLLFSILKLYCGKLPKAWAISSVVASVLVANAEAFGFDAMTRRWLMHVILEPLILVATLYFAGRYVAKQVATGGRIDFLASATILTAFMFAIRLLLMLDKNLLLTRWQSHALFYFFMSVVVTTYFCIPRLRRWLLFR